MNPYGFPSGGLGYSSPGSPDLSSMSPQDQDALLAYLMQQQNNPQNAAWQQYVQGQKARSGGKGKGLLSGLLGGSSSSSGGSNDAGGFYE